MRRLLLLFLLFLLLCLDGPVARAQGDPASEIVWRVNGLRATYGVPAYQVDAALTSAAQAQAVWSAANNHFGHDGPGGSTPLDRALAAGYGDGELAFAIENVASGTISLNTPEMVVTMWQGDWGHLNAMISADYEHIGVGYAEGEEFNWFVMMVGWVGEKASSGESSVIGATTAVPGSVSVPFTVSTPGDDGAIYHEVQPGQAAWTIAVMYGISLEDLLALNDLTENAWLHPGDILLIRPPDSITPTPTPQPVTRTPRPAATRTQSVTASPTPTGQVQPTLIPIEETAPSPEPGGFPVSLVVGVGTLLLIGLVFYLRSRRG
jgi:LysM repeat protein